MKRFFLISFLAMAFMAQAQTITIGEDTTISNQVPIYTFYNHSLTEHLFLAEEIEYAGSLKALRFRIAYTYNNPYTCDIEVFVKHVTKDSFSGLSDYEPVTINDRVYSGSWTIPANTDDWISMEFDTPFAYNGTDNLLIAINAKSDEFAIRYFKYTAVANTVFSCYSDTQELDPSDLSSFSGSKEVIDQRPNIKLVFESNVGVIESNKQELTVYPNPATELIFIDDVDDEIVSVYDASGRLVMQERCHGQLNLGSLECGIYAITTGKGMKKIVKK